MRFINDDNTVKANARKAARISINDLQRLMFERVMQVNSSWYEDDINDYLHSVDDIKSDEGLVTAIKTLFFDDPTIRQDNLYDLGSCDIAIPGVEKYSNASHDYYYNDGKYGEMMFGWHTLPNGFTFLGFTTAEGGCLDAFAILYFDGQKIRLYTPVRGNHINMAYQVVLGSEYEDQNIKASLVQRCRDANIDVEALCGCICDMYVQLYTPEAESSNLPFYWDAMREDISKTIAVNSQIIENPELNYDVATQGQAKFFEERACVREMSTREIIAEWVRQGSEHPDKNVKLRCNQYGPNTNTDIIWNSNTISVEGCYAPHLNVFIDMYRSKPNFLEELTQTLIAIFNNFDLVTE